jgi:hypothetical protein
VYGRLAVVCRTASYRNRKNHPICLCNTAWPHCSAHPSKSSEQIGSHPLQQFEPCDCERWVRKQMDILVKPMPSSCTRNAHLQGEIDEPRTEARNDCIPGSSPTSRGYILDINSFTLIFGFQQNLQTGSSVPSSRTPNTRYLVHSSVMWCYSTQYGPMIPSTALGSSCLCIHETRAHDQRCHIQLDCGGSSKVELLPCVDLYSARHCFWSSLVWCRSCDSLGWQT